MEILFVTRKIMIACSMVIVPSVLQIWSEEFSEGLIKTTCIYFNLIIFIGQEFKSLHY